MPGGPFGRLLHLVVAGAQHVSLVRAVGRRALGQRLLVEANAVLVEEVPVHQVLLDHLVRKPRHQRGVGARHDGDPLHVLVGGQVVAARVDAYYAHALLLARDRQIVAQPVARHARLGRRVAEQHHELAGGQRAERPGAPAVAVGVGLGAEVERAVGVVAVARHLSAHQVEQAEEGVVHHEVLLDSRALLDEDGLVSVCVLHALELAGDGVEGLVPADALVLALSALGAFDALHGVVEPVGAVDPAAYRTAAQACASLEPFAAETSVAGVVRLDVGDLAALHVALQHACASAVHVAVGPDDLVAFVGHGLGHVCSEHRAGGRGPSSRCGQGSQRPGRLDERAASELRVYHAELLSLFHTLRSARGLPQAPTRCPAPYPRGPGQSGANYTPQRPKRCHIKWVIFKKCQLEGV